MRCLDEEQFANELRPTGIVVVRRDADSRRRAGVLLPEYQTDKPISTNDLPSERRSGAIGPPCDAAQETPSIRRDRPAPRRKPDAEAGSQERRVGRCHRCRRATRGCLVMCWRSSSSTGSICLTRSATTAVADCVRRRYWQAPTYDGTLHRSETVAGWTDLVAARAGPAPHRSRAPYPDPNVAECRPACLPSHRRQPGLTGRRVAHLDAAR